ncbi:MAG: peptidylprolyl isomerase [Nanoarchaeota archaeon]|nr:peptidylprolyl isomerase [Nanoarchaeota archaeon]
MQKNDFIRISYSGKIKETQQEFDSGDSAVVVGAKFVLPGIDEALEQMQIGEKKTIEVAPEKGFGLRDQKYIKLVPVSQFRNNKMDPYPGMIVSADNMHGRVLSVNSGRVRVDFNHPLAGKTLVYDLEVKAKIDDDKEKIKALAEFYTKLPADKIKVEIKDKEAEVTVPPMVSPVYKKKIADDARAFAGIEKTKFSEVYEKGGEKEEESKAEKAGESKEEKVEEKKV